MCIYSTCSPRTSLFSPSTARDTVARLIETCSRAGYDVHRIMFSIDTAERAQWRDDLVYAKGCRSAYPEKPLVDIRVPALRGHD